MRVALVHDWLVAQRGGENVLVELARLFPGAPVYTLVHARGRVHPDIEAHPIHTSFIQHLPGAPHHFRHYLPLFPTAVAAWDLSSYDLVVSSSHCVAKGVRTSRQQRHVAYVHTPMRYLWDELPSYVPALPGRRLLVPLARWLSAPLRRWDVASAKRPDTLLANSSYVAARIARFWGRQSQVLYPPVDVDFFAAAPEPDRHGFLVVSALVPYKRVDLAVRLASSCGLDLTVVGEGSERRRLERMAGPTVRFAGAMDREELRRAYARAEALFFCGVEDFGIVPVEAMAAGCPVVALDKGGVAETVVGSGPEATGVFFARPHVASLHAALARLTRKRREGAFARSVLEARARQFDREHFLGGLKRCLDFSSVTGYAASAGATISGA